MCVSLTHACACTHIYIDTRTHTHTYTYTHTHSSLVDQSCNILSQVKLVGINNSDIVDCKTTPILGLIWSIILRFQVCSYLLNIFASFTLYRKVFRVVIVLQCKQETVHIVLSVNRRPTRISFCNGTRAIQYRVSKA